MHKTLLRSPPKYLRILLKILGVFVGLLLLLWLGVLAFIHYNKNSFVNIITTQINDNINGEVSVQDIKPTLFRDFPDVSFKLSKLVVRDSLHKVHGKDIIQLSAGYVSIDLLSALRKDAFVKKLSLSNGTIAIYTDENGVSNTNLFKKKEKGGKTKNPIKIFELSDITLNIVNKPKNKDFLLKINDCDIDINHSDTGWLAKLDVNMGIGSFMFNTDKGSFLKDHTVSAELVVHFNTEKNILHIPLQNATVDEFDYKLGGDFVFTDSPSTFNLDIAATKIPYDNILALLTPPIREKLEQVKLSSVDEVQVKLIGNMVYKDTPYVKADFTVQNKTVEVPQGKINNCSFIGYFTNVVEKGMGHGDPNSMIAVSKITGNYYGIDFTTTNTSVTNLADPLLKMELSSQFALKELNELIASNSFKFNSGNASLQLKCSVPLSATRNSAHPPRIDGKLSFNNTVFAYTPRNLKFDNAAGDIVFDGSDVYIKNLSLTSEKNKLALNASINNLLNLYYTAPEKVIIDCTIKSSKIDLGEYTAFLASRTNTTPQTPKPSNSNTPQNIKRFSQQLDEIMDLSVVDIALDINEVAYKKFAATGVRAGIVLKRSEILLRNIHVGHAGGDLKLNATVRSGQTSSNFNVDADLQKVNVQKLFYVFDNFGQTAILDSNIRGIVSAKVKAKGGIKFTGDIIPKSLNGTVDYNLQDGMLVDFEPLGTIGKIIFFNRDLNNIKVEPLTGTLDIKDSRITINPVLVQTSAFNIFTEGVYGIPTGTDIKIQVPLRNPKKDLNKDNKKMAVKDMKRGIVINLRATDNNTGKVKIKLGKGKDE